MKLSAHFVLVSRKGCIGQKSNCVPAFLGNLRNTLDRFRRRGTYPFSGYFNSCLITSFSLSAVENGANALAEGFLFAVAAALIIGEQWRSSRNQSKRRDDVDDKLEDLDTRMTELNTRLGSLTAMLQEQLDAERQKCVP